MQGHNIRLPYSHKIEGYTNLYELRPGYKNLEYRLFYFWHSNHAQIVHSCFEAGKKREKKGV